MVAVPDDTLVVTGGVGGITADYTDMLSHARVLETLAGVVLDRVTDTAAVAQNPDLLASSVLSPGTAAAVEAQVLVATAGPDGLVVTSGRLTASAVSLRVSVTAYQAVDAAQARLTGWGTATAAFPALLLGPLARTGVEVAAEIGSGRFDDVLGTVTSLGPAFMDNLYDNPWIVDGVVKDGPALLTAIGVGLTAPFGPLPLVSLNAWTMRAEGSPFPPADLEQASADVVAIGLLFGLMRAGRGDAAPDSDPAAGSRIGWRSPSDPAYAVRSPDSLADLLKGVADLGLEPGSVRIFAVPGADGERRWVVELPGTQEWGVVAGPNPVDLTNNLRLIAGQDTAQNEAIRDAMRQAGIRPGEDVLLAGHSQGGIAAASLASDPATRAEFDITNVVTAGSPVARFDIPDDVEVLSIEHAQDAVPRLDGEPNPDRVNWVTVVRDPTGLRDQGEVVDSTGAVHHGTVYAQTAALLDVSSDPSVAGVRAGLEPFLARPGPVVYQDFDLTRRPR